MTPPPDSDFFVGYLPLSRSLRKSLIVVTVALVSALIGAGFALANSTQGAGRGRFAFAQAQGTLGVLTIEPTPMLWTVDETVPGGMRGTLLVRQGKFGLNAMAKQLAGQVVRVQGSVIERDGERMSELSKAPEPASEQELLQRPARRVLGAITLSGEIEDSKCYLGRMRPGDRRTHRACAQLCIRGGIPALLVARNEHGEPKRYLLATHTGLSIDTDVLPFVAEPVQISGVLVQLGNWLVVETDLEHVVRL